MRYGFTGGIITIFAGMAFSQFYILLLFAIGYLLGIMVGFFQVFLFDIFLKNIKRWKQLLISIVIFETYVFVLVIVFTPLASYMGLIPQYDSLYTFVQNQNVHTVYIFIFVISTLLLIYFKFEKVIGRNNMFNYVFNQYKSPKKEDRIFMFLDLTNSTGLTEQMGNEKYYSFLFEFINDLSDPILDCKAEIYQYVGDEIVLTWDIKNGIKNNNCIDFFFKVKDQIKRRKQIYLDKYGTYPAFKAAVHCGSVINAQVGSLKNEIIYCGDPLNTTARIEALCKKYNSELLISGELMKILDRTNLKVESIGQLELRGKKELVDIYRFSV